MSPILFWAKFVDVVEVDMTVSFIWYPGSLWFVLLIYEMRFISSSYWLLYNGEDIGCNVARPTQNQYVWRIDYNRFLYRYFQCLSYLQFNLKYSFFPW